jgi:ribose transport system substrate-binding protein
MTAHGVHETDRKGIIMKVRSFALLAAAGALAATAACGGPTAAGGNTKAKSVSKHGPLTIGLSTFFLGNSWQAETVQLFQDECKKLGSKVIKRCFVQNANSNTTQQIAQIQGMINQKVDAIVLDANSDTGLNAVIGKAMAAGIPVINYDSIISGTATAKVNTEQTKWGRITGQWLIDQLHGKGKIIVLNGAAGTPISSQRYAEAKALFAKTPGIKILQQVNADWDQAKAQSAVSQMLNAYPEIDGVWSQGGAMTAGAMIEFQKAGRKLVPMTGEAYNGFLKLWNDNKSKGFTSIAPGQPNYLSVISLDAAIRAARGQKVPANIDVPLPVINASNVASQYRADKPPSYWVLDSMSQADIDKLITG